MMTDLTLIEQTKVNRARLTGAFLLGPAARARGRVPLLQRLIAGVIIAAVASAACVGVSFVQHILAEQREARLEQERARLGASEVIDVAVTEAWRANAREDTGNRHPDETTRIERAA